MRKPDRSMRRVLGLIELRGREALGSAVRARGVIAEKLNFTCAPKPNPKPARERSRTTARTNTQGGPQERISSLRRSLLTPYSAIHIPHTPQTTHRQRRPCSASRTAASRPRAPRRPSSVSRSHQPSSQPCEGRVPPFAHTSSHTPHISPSPQPPTQQRS